MADYMQSVACVPKFFFKAFKESLERKNHISEQTWFKFH